MSGTAECYLQARIEFDEAGKRFTALIDRCERIVQHGRETPEYLMFQGTGIGFAWPHGTAAHAVIVGDGEWPEARTLQQALADWHAARAAAQEAWEALPADFKRAGLPLPPAALRSDVPPPPRRAAWRTVAVEE